MEIKLDISRKHISFSLQLVLYVEMQVKLKKIPVNNISIFTYNSSDLSGYQHGIKIILRSGINKWVKELNEIEQDVLNLVNDFNCYI